MRRLLCMIAIISAAMAFSGCGDQGADCFSSTGPIVRQDRSVPPFDSVQLNDNLNLVLTLDSVYAVSVEAGANLQAGIVTKVIDNTLVIANNNSCNWVRSYDKPLNVYVSTRNLYKLNYNSAGNVTTTNKLRGGPLLVEIWGGCGVIDLDMDMYAGNFYMKLGTSTLKLRGKCSIASFASGDYGKLDARDLETGYSYIANSGSNDSYVRANTYLSAIINSIGNIYFTGNPDTIRTEINGAGQVIRF